MPAEPIPSKAAVKGHPIHPMLVAFPIVFFLSALFCDVAYLVADRDVWATAALWLVGAGVVGGIAAAVPGLIDFVSLDQVRGSPTAIKHGAGNFAIVVLELVSFFIRLPDPQDGVVPVGIAISIIAAAGLTFTGWLGGQLSYKFMIGANPDMDEDDAPVVGSRS